MRVVKYQERKKWPKVKLYHSDCLAALKKLSGNSVDSCVTDPPAGIGFMGKSWDDFRKKNRKNPRRAFTKWLQQIMEEVLRVLKPGAHALVWSLPRTSHWTATALENAGFEVRDCIYHLFGSGFPKNLNVSKAIDKQAGAKRKIIAKNKHADRYPKGPGGVGFHGGPGEYTQTGRPPEPLTASATDLAKQWEGWGTALKPAAEVWWLVRKPLEGTIVQNVKKWGTGALNIDECRVPVDPGGKDDKRLGGNGSWNPTGRSIFFNGRGDNVGSSPLGRWPANVVHDGSPEVMEAFARFGEKASNSFPGRVRRTKRHETFAMSGSLGKLDGDPNAFYGDTGTAARFFYTAKPSRSEREKDLRLPKKSPAEATSSKDGQKRLDCPRTGAGSPAGAVNYHPTVKALALMRYLCKLITPPKGVVLDPFMGSGSTMLAAWKEGFDFVGMEIDAGYFGIACARMERAHRKSKVGFDWHRET